MHVARNEGVLMSCVICSHTVHKAQRKHLLAAHRILHREGEGLLLSLPNKEEEEPVPNKEEEDPPV